MSLTKIGSIGINTGIAFAGVTTIVTLNTANDALSIGATVNVGSGITLGASGDIFATGVSTVTTLKVGSGVTLSSDGDIFATGVTTATSFVGDGSQLTGVASTENIRTNTNATFLQNINVSGTTTATGNVNVSGANITLQDSGGSSDDRLVFGAGSDLSIYHDGTNNWIKTTGVQGAIYLESSTNLNLRVNSGETAIVATADGAVDLYYDNSKKLETTDEGINIPDGILQVQSTSCNIDLMETGGPSNHTRLRQNNGNFYLQKLSGDKNTSTTAILVDHGNENVELHQGGNKKFETTSGGVEVFGELQMDDGNSHIKLIDGARIDIGTGADLKLYHDGSNSYINNNTGGLRINTGSDEVQINKSTSEYMARFITDGNVELYSNNVKRFQTRSGGGAADGIAVYGNSSNTAVNLFTDSTVRGTVYANSSNMVGFLDSGGDWAIKHTNDSQTEFFVQTNRKAAIDADGLKFNNDTAAANALDDYEEGSFTPTMATNGGSPSFSYSYQRGKYVKVGRQVTIWTFIYATIGGTETGDLQITGLPFTVRDEYAQMHSADYGNWDGFPSGHAGLGGYAQLNDTFIRLLSYGDKNSGSINASNWGNNTYLYGTISYMTDS